MAAVGAPYSPLLALFGLFGHILALLAVIHPCWFFFLASMINPLLCELLCPSRSVKPLPAGRIRDPCPFSQPKARLALDGCCRTCCHYSLDLEFNSLSLLLVFSDVFVDACVSFSWFGLILLSRLHSAEMLGGSAASYWFLWPHWSYWFFRML
ncbi:hypothetical protein U1Q18_030393 [Sarracenia purpurea var. burkii]